MRSWLFAVGVLVLAFPSVAHPQTSRNRLRDLGSVGVSVLSLDVNARNAGLSEENRGGPHPLDSSAAKLRWIPGSCF